MGHYFLDTQQVVHNTHDHIGIYQDDADEWNDEDELARLAEDDELAGLAEDDELAGLAEDDDNSHSGGMSSPDLREPGPGKIQRSENQ